MTASVLLPSYLVDGPLNGRDDTATYDGGPPPPDEMLAGARFYVPPYMGAPADLALMARMPALEVCQTLTAGYDNVLPHLPGGVVLCNAGGVHDASTAELALGLILASLRGIDEFARAQPSGEWRHGRRSSLADRRVLVVGNGGVGRAVRARLEPFEVDVTVASRTPRPEADPPVHGMDRLPALLAHAEVVVLAVPLDDRTRGLVDTDFLAGMPDGALVVNVSRGPVVDTDALLAETSTGRLRAALDVTDPEPLPPDHPLWRAPGVLISPHVGGNTTAFLPRARRMVAAQLRRWDAGEPLEHVVRPAG